MIKFNEMDTQISSFEERFNNFLKKRNLITKDVRNSVHEIINNIRERGDQALQEYTEKFDGFERGEFLVSKNEIDNALKDIDTELIQSLEYAFDRILSYQSKCFNSLDLESFDERISRKFRIIDSLGMYIPGGKASYPSTVLMGAAPAIACGVNNISIASPTQNGALNPLTIAAAKVAGIDRIFKIGGAQAIAAMAIGTKQVEKVDKIIGPGNIFVAEAKKQLFGEVGIDSIAGPSEIVVFADKTSDPETIAWDLMAQSEHDKDASSILVCSCEKIINSVKDIIEKEIISLERYSIIKDSIESNGMIFRIRENLQAKDIINSIAPEHLHIAFDHENYEDENQLVAGLVLKGRVSANSFSDYVLGPSHILPTNSSSKFSSPLSVEDFLVSYSFVSLDKNNTDELEEYIKHTSRIAKYEGLTAHAISAEKRLKD
tara:strand:+ start:2210 stop:3505 length:1296 start_codon:yes stop_codon:yes gene_type:complete